MSNYFNKPADLAPQTKARTVDINNMAQLIDSAFDKLPTELVLKRGTVNYAEDTGAVNAIAVSVNPTVITALADGMEVRVKVKFANTTAAPTLNLNGLGAVVIARADGSAIQPSDIPANIVTFSYNATTAKWVFTPPGAKGEKGDQGVPGNSNVLRKARSSNTAITVADAGDFIDITAGTFTQTFDPAGALGDGWHVWYRNSGTGDITLDPSGTETIDGLASFIMYPGEARLIQCDGTALRSIVINSFNKTFTTSGNFIRPPGYTQFNGLLWGGGGSGAKTSLAGGGGGGGACVPFNILSSALAASTAVTIAAGGAAVTVSGNVGNVGGNSTFAGITAYGGGGGGYSGSATVGGGTGGGALGAGSTGSGTVDGVQGGQPSYFMSGNSTPMAMINNSMGGGGTANNLAGSSVYGGAGGGGSVAAGSSVFGGGGGGGVYSTTVYAAGTSAFGGAGGAAGDAVAGTTGFAPAGGGGATRTGASSGAGARGEMRIWGVI